VHLSAAVHLGLRALEATREAIGHAWTRVCDRGLASPETVWTTLRGRSLAARPVEVFDGPDAIAATLAEVAAALTAANIEYEIAETEPVTVAVPSAQWAAVFRALGSLTLYGQQGHALAPLSRLRPHPGSVRVFRPWATRRGGYLAGPDVGVDVVPGAAPAPASPLGDIDAVFTWVDGSDPAWQERKRHRLEAMGKGPRHRTAANDARFAQIGELRYALRSVTRYAPWLRRMYLVTDGQQPSWLAAEFPQVKLVRHDEIFSDSTAFPTFNSHAIESQLHHIPGLAERYLYFNDDFFLGRYTQPTDYFTDDGKPRVFLTDDPIPYGPATPHDQPVVAAAKNNTALLLPLTGTRVNYKLKHAPYAMLRSVAYELEALAEERFQQTARSAFRSAADLSVASSLLPHYALASGRAALSDIRHFYADVASNELAWRLPSLLEHREADIICLNATSDPPKASERVDTWARRHFLPVSLTEHREGYPCLPN
jgi:hypothetical protein